ncbi:uncharacterized protein LOC110851735 [Folsomia candida]|uniref:uncharacterized protein LOC110851735 n=1 Tax=Folsomia candida TaxID=158441 RepID=UPI000B90386D|nr:uncharacterized protein LOC110851735 [Folsomia candida]
MSNAATPGQAKLLYRDPKNKLCEKICLNVHSFGSLAESIVHGKEQHQPLTQAINNFVSTEKHIEESHENLKKLAVLNLHMTYQYDAINKFSQQLDQLKEVSQSMRR